MRLAGRRILTLWLASSVLLASGSVSTGLARDAVRAGELLAGRATASVSGLILALPPLIAALHPFASAPAAHAQAGARVLLARSSVGWEYSFDSVTWSPGRTPFIGYGGLPPPCFFVTPNTLWPRDRGAIRLRRTLVLAGAPTAALARVLVDDQLTLRINGELIGTFTSGQCGTYWNLNQGDNYRPYLPIPDGKLRAGANTIEVDAVNFAGAGSQSVDLELEGVLGPRVEPPPIGTEDNQPMIDTFASQDPVNTATGAFLYARTDLAIAGRGPTPVFTRSYASNDTRDGPLGKGWTHNYAIRLTDPGDASGALILVGPQGRSDRYTPVGNGAYTPPPGVQTTLVANPDGTYLATHKDRSTWALSSVGELTSIADRHGNRSDLTYTDGRLTQVSDPAGRGVVSLSYTPDGRLLGVADWLSPARGVTYSYDPQGRLRTAIDKENQTTTYGYAGLTPLMTSITDANGRVAVTKVFDAQGGSSPSRTPAG